MTKNIKKAKKAIVAKWDGLSEGAQKVSKFISAIVVIFGALSSCLAWTASQINSSTDTRIDELSESTHSKIDQLSETVQSTTKETNMAISRLTLLQLISHDPTNRAAIEKEAYTYFVVLNGDTYALSIYSEWAEKYGGDINIIAGIK